VTTAPWLVLDVDDTLVDTCGTGWRKCAETARRLGLTPPSRAAFMALYGTMTFADCVRRLHRGTDLAAYRRVYDSLARWAPPEPIGQVRRAIRDARLAGFRLAVLTNGDGPKTNRKLAALRLDTADFEFVCHSGNSPVPKPAVAAFRRLAREFGVCPRTSWYVSDQAADWKAAARAGFRTVGVVTGRVHSHADGTVPNLLAASLEAAIACLAGLAGAQISAAGRPVRHVGLDAGFTLIDQVCSPAQLIAAGLAAHGVETSVRDIAKSFERQLAAGWPRHRCWASDDEIYAALLPLYRAVTDSVLREHPVAGIRGGCQAICEAAVRGYVSPRNWRARAGAADALRSFAAAGLTVGVLSNWQSTLPEVLLATGLGPLVRVICASAAIGTAKPEPAAFRSLSGAMDVAHPADVVFCGDDPVADIAGALRAGHRAALIGAAWDHESIQEVVRVVVA
jgi:FMN phosphatase YigB (HAD superfamily)